MREFRAATRTGKTKVWSIGLDESDPEVYRIRYGQLDGKMQEKSDRPGPKGKEGTKSHMTASENCLFHMEREIRKKIEKGYVEYVDGNPIGPVATTSIDFSKPLPKNFCPYKPLTEKRFSDKKHRELFRKGRAIYTVKRDGECHIAVHHTGGMGWRIYSRRMDDVTAHYPRLIADLMFGMLPEGTIFTGEMVMVRNGRDDTAAIESYARSKPERAHEMVESGRLPPPQFWVYDTLFWDGNPLNDMTWEARRKLVSDQPVWNGKTIGLIAPVKYCRPDNWERAVIEHGIEGFVFIDREAVPGDKFFTFNGSAARPKGHYKLKINHTEDCVVYAASRGTGDLRDTIGALYIRQRHPQTGKWFDCGKVGSGMTHKDDGPLDRSAIESLLTEKGVPVLDDDRFLSEYLKSEKSGPVVEVEFKERQPGTNRFKFPVLLRIRNDKEPRECVAQQFFK